MKIKDLIYFLFLSVTVFAACGDDDGISYGKKTDDTGVVVSSEITTRMETPQIKTDGSTIVLSHSTKENGKDIMTYCLEFDKATYHSRWVAFRFDGITRKNNTSRSNNPYADDPDLPSSLQIGDGYFSGYQRGHLCASADRLYSAEANEITFYMSNMSPMLGSFNQGYWVTLEGNVQRLGRNATFADTLYVVKGGTILSNQLKGYMTTMKGKRMGVPKYYYMALLKVKNGQYSSIAFWMEHKEYGYRYESQAPLNEFYDKAITVNELESLTGIDFFPNLPDDKEETIESQLVPANWLKEK